MWVWPSCLSTASPRLRVSSEHLSSSMAKRNSGLLNARKKARHQAEASNGGIVALTKELFQAAITLRGSVEPADYKRYVLPIIFLRFLSLRYDRRRAELEAL